MKAFAALVCTLAICVASAASAQALDIAVDIDSTRLSGADTSGTIVTQDGFTSWDLTNFTNPSDPFVVDGITFELFGLPANQSRVRTTGGGGGAQDSLLSDFVFNESSTSNGVAVGLRVIGLEVGTYAMQSWHYDSNSSVTSTSNFINIETRDQGVADSTITHVSGFPFSTTAAFFKFDVTESGQVKEIIFREADSTADGGTDHNRSRLNGFTLRAVPEPASLALVAMGLGLAVCTGRRRTGR